jgi:hypothetical protein
VGRDHFRYLYSDCEEEPSIAIASHSKRYWAIVDRMHTDDYWRSDGFETVGGALQHLLKLLSTRVWQKAKKDGIF